MTFLAQFLSVALCVLLTTEGAAAQVADGLHVEASEKGVDLMIEVTDATGAAVADAAIVVRLPDDGPGGSFADGTRATVVYSDATGHAAVTGMTWGSDPGTSTIHIMASRGELRGATTIDHIIGAHKIATAPIRTIDPSAGKPSPVVSKPPQPGVPEMKQETAAAPVPRVTVTTPAGTEKLGGGGISKKWLILALLAAGAGAGAAFVVKGKSSSSTSSASTSGVSIGNPTVSVGHP